MSIEQMRETLLGRIAELEAEKKEVDKLICALNVAVEKLAALPPDVLGPLLSISSPGRSDRFAPTIDIKNDQERGQSVGKRKPKETLFDQIVSFFLRNSNEPATIGEIMDAIGMKRGPISTVIYSTHKNYFTSIPLEGSTKLRTWMLSEEGMKRLMSAT